MATKRNRAGRVRFYRLAGMEEEWLNPKMNRKLVVGEREMFGYIAFKKGAFVPPHHHLSEQITFVLSGSLKFRIDGSEYVVRENEALVIPSHVVHEALAEEDTLELDLFSPLRNDWLEKTDLYLRGEVRSRTRGKKSSHPVPSVAGGRIPPKK